MINEFNSKKIRMIAGLGNPGADYRATFHNVGFLALDYFSDGTPETEWREGKNFSYLKMNGTIFVKPAVFMNESGETIRQALRYFKMKAENLLVIHDDSDIELGRWKIGFGRGAAGHRGVASIISRLKTKNFWRARIGVRNRRGKAGDFILKKITPAEEKNLTPVFQGIKEMLMQNEIHR